MYNDKGNQATSFYAHPGVPPTCKGRPQRVLILVLAPSVDLIPFDDPRSTVQQYALQFQLAPRIVEQGWWPSLDDPWSQYTVTVVDPISTNAEGVERGWWPSFDDPRSTVLIRSNSSKGRQKSVLGRCNTTQSISILGVTTFAKIFSKRGNYYA